MTLNFDVGFNPGSGGGPTPPTPSSGTYIHNQSEASDTWTINHNLGKWPSIEVVDSANSVVTGQYDYVSENTIIAYFNGKFKGKAFLN